MIIPVILSGGMGTRLWPISRESHPKPFMTLPDGQTLIQKTFERASQFADINEILTITNSDFYLKCKSHYHGKSKLSFILEPTPRNTAPAIAMAAFNVLLTYGQDATLLVLPADHLITDIPSFIASCETAFSVAEKNHLVTFGIKPTSPETGYGYIEFDHAKANGNIFPVRQFVEKPSHELAEAYLKSGQFLWNSGMFCFKASSLLTQLEKYAPELYQAAKNCWDISLQKNKDASAVTLDKESFSAIESISIDYALMEKSNEIYVVACDFDWQDIGSWKAIKNIHEHDKNGNAIFGEAVLIDSQNNFIHSENRMIASIGIQNLVIIDTPDALLVAHRDRSQEVSQIVKTLKNNAHETYHTHKTAIRPWGTYTVLEETPTFKIKRLLIKPYAMLSLQSHKHRSEHWIVVSGTATIIKEDQQFQLNENESTFIPQHCKHRLGNNQETDLIIIEVQTGSYLGEDDIIRYEDNYEREVTV